MSLQQKKRIANLTLHKESFSFAAGHFTIFSATEREKLHGHNYHISVAFELVLDKNGLSFDYRTYKQQIRSICQQLNTHFLLPTTSPHLQLTEDDSYYFAEFNGKKIPFLKEDVVLLPISNVTIEELSNWFLQNLLTNQVNLEQHGIKMITVEVYNGPGQSGGATWRSDNV